MNSHEDLLRRITVNPQIYGGKPIIRGMRMAVEHLLSMLAAGDTVQDLLAAYPRLEPDDFRAVFLYAERRIMGERFEPLPSETSS